MFKWLKSRFFSAHDLRRPPGLFARADEFFWHEADCERLSKTQKQMPQVALVEEEIMSRGPTWLDPSPEGSRSYRVRLAAGNGTTIGIAYAHDAEPPIKVGDVTLFLPLVEHRLNKHWIGPLIAELEPAYSAEGYVVRRYFS